MASCLVSFAFRIEGQLRLTSSEAKAQSLTLARIARELEATGWGVYLEKPTTQKATLSPPSPILAQAQTPSDPV